MLRVRASAPVNAVSEWEGAHVSLIADGDAQFPYAMLGFKPTAPASVGMFRTL